MKKILFLLFVCIAANGKAQQKELDSLLNELKKHPQEDTVRLNLLYLTAMTYYYINPDEGIKKSDEGISLAYKLKNEVKLGNAISSKGCNYMAEGKYDSSLVFLKTSLQLFERHNYERGASTALNIIGIVQLNTGDYAGALNTYSKNLLMAEQVNNTSQIIGSCGNLGMVFRVMSNYAEALKYDLRALDLSEKSNNKTSLIAACGEVGLTYRGLKENDIAKQYYQRSLNICIQTGNKRGEATMLLALGQILSDKKNYQQALSYYKQALQISNSTDNVQTVTETLGEIGDVYKNISDFANAINYYKKALELAQKLGDKTNIAYLLGEIGDMYTKIPQQQNQALSYLQQSLSIAKAIGSLDKQQITLSYLSNFYEKQKNYEKALAFDRQADTVQNSLLNDTTRQQITHLEMQYQFAKTQDSIKAITDKQQALAKAEIQKQHIVEASTMAGAGFLLLAGLGGFIFYKRNRDIRFMKQISDTELKALRAQIDPHFIGNSLTSISAFMIRNDTQKASEYLDKFSKLMRSILENSDQEEVSLADDLNALEQYIQLEALRMENNFTYEIQVADDIDKNNTLIQQLILQPFVENSIRHGLEKKNGNGKIIISIQRENNMLICSVEDNGIGRRKVEAYKERTNENKRKSFGLQITSDRIKIINKLKNTNASIKILDLQQGTKVEVKLPLELSF